MAHQSGLTKKQRKQLKIAEKHRQEAKTRREKDSLLSMIKSIPEDQETALKLSIQNAVLHRKWLEGDAIIDQGLEAMLHYLGHDKMLALIQETLLGSTTGRDLDAEETVRAEYGG